MMNSGRNFGFGLVSGLHSGMAIGSMIGDGVNNRRVNEAMQAKLTENTTDDPAPATEPLTEQNRDPARSEEDVFAEAANKEFSDTPAAPSTPAPEAPPTAKKTTWSIGSGKSQKTWDTKPTDEDVRQWRYENILNTAGSKYAEHYLDNEMAKDAKKRAAERDGLALDQLRTASADAKDLRAAQGEMEGNDNLAERVKASGGAEGYIASQEAGMDAPFSPEQRKAISDASGVAMSPTNRFYAAMKQASILRRTNPAAAMELEKAATRQAAGQLFGAYEAGDTATMKQLYNIFPNGHLVNSVSIDPKNGDVVYRDGNGISRASKSNFVNQVIASYDPDKAMNHMTMEERLDEMRRQNEANNQRFYDKLAVAGLGGGKGSKSGSNGAGVMPTELDVADVNKFKDFYSAGKDDSGSPFYAASIGDRRGKFNFDSALTMANQIVKNGQQVSPTAAIQTAARVLAADSVRKQIQAELADKATDDTKRKALEAELKTLPAIGYRINDEDGSLNRYLQDNSSINASTHELGRVTPGSAFDMTSDKGLVGSVVQKFNSDPNWKAFGEAMSGDGDPAEKMRAFTEKFVSAAQKAAEESGRNPEVAAKAAEQRVAVMRRYLDVYQKVTAKPPEPVTPKQDGSAIFGQKVGPAIGGVPVPSHNDPYLMAQRAKAGLGMPGK